MCRAVLLPRHCAVARNGAEDQGQWLRLFDSLADSEDVAVRVANMHLSDTPRFVGGRPGDLDTLFKAVLVDGIDVVDPDRHPDAMVLAIGKAPRRCQIAFAATALPVLTQEDLALPRADAAKGWWIAPVPALLPSELFKPGEALLNV